MLSFPFMMQVAICSIQLDTEGKEKDLPVFWGLLRKASKTDNIVYYRTDPDLSITDRDILLQGQDRYIQRRCQDWLYCF